MARGSPDSRHGCSGVTRLFLLFVARNLTHQRPIFERILASSPES
jgi:hypothetical protein